MQDIFDVPGSAAPECAAAEAAGPRLDFERLDVYRVAVEFHALAASVRLPPGRRELRDQLDRAALFDVLGNLGIAPRSTCARARGLLVRIVQMHTRLCFRLNA